METTYFRFASDGEKRNETFSQASLILLGTSLLWVVLVVLGQTQMANALEYPGYERHVVVLGLIIALDVMVAVPFAALRLEGRPARYSILRLLGILLNIVAVVFFLEIVPHFAEKGVAWASWYQREDRLLYVFIANLIGSLAVFLIFLPQYLRIRWTWNGELLGKMMKYALPLVVVGIAGVINQSSYITFQKYILPNSLTENLSAGGIYSAATRIALLMSLFTTAFNYAAEPFFFQHAKTEGARQTYADVAKAFTIAASILMAGILLYLDVVQLILGTSYRSGLDIVPILLLGFLFLGLYYNVSVWYRIMDKTHIGALISTCASLITIVLNIVLIREFEVVGSAWAALACYTFMVVVCFLIGKKYYPVPYDLVRIAIPIAGALAVYWLGLQLKELTGDRFWISLLINTVLFAGFISVLYRMEGKLILSIIRRTK
jgi:O-antigen/teichoic acid export membrane protein